MIQIKLIKHCNGAPGLRLFGLGPYCIPMNGVKKLKVLFDEHTFWARNRKLCDIKKILKNSSIVVSAWKGNRLVGFGRATNDGIYRAVLWDVVIANDLQGKGIGKLLLQELLNSKRLSSVEKIYLMTTKCSDFYEHIGFKKERSQNLFLMELNEE